MELVKEVNTLKDKLNINSTNSSIPTSKEIYRIEKSTKPKSNRKVEAQKGHKFNGYKMCSADITKEVLAEENVCKCGGSLILDNSCTTHQKIEIPEIKAVVTEYNLKHKICAKCKRKYKAKLDNYKISGKKYGQLPRSAKSHFFHFVKNMAYLEHGILYTNKSKGRIFIFLKIGCLYIFYCKFYSPAESFTFFS